MASIRMLQCVILTNQKKKEWLMLQIEKDFHYPDYDKWGPYSIFGEIVQEPFLSVSGSSSMPLNYYRWKWPPDESTWKSRWDKARATDKYIATGESARRYYSAKEYLYTGAENVFRRSATEHDNRFFDDFVVPT